MYYQEAINKTNQQISEKMKREIFERLSILPIDTMHKCDGRVSAHEAIVSAVDEARRYRMYEKMEEVSGLKKFYEEVYPQVQENLKMLVEYQKIGTLEEVREAVEKQKWIPCSERSPENISTVIVKVKEIEKPTIGWYGNMSGWRLTERDFEELKDFTVIAWMPLPNLYREDDV